MTLKHIALSTAAVVAVYVALAGALEGCGGEEFTAGKGAAAVLVDGDASAAGDDDASPVVTQDGAMIIVPIPTQDAAGEDAKNPEPIGIDAGELNPDAGSGEGDAMTRSDTGLPPPPVDAGRQACTAGVAFCPSCPLAETACCTSAGLCACQYSFGLCGP